jgi:hypothetical protein
VELQREVRRHHRCHGTSGAAALEHAVARMTRVTRKSRCFDRIAIVLARCNAVVHRVVCRDSHGPDGVRLLDKLIESSRHVRVMCRWAWRHRDRSHALQGNGQCNQPHHDDPQDNQHRSSLADGLATGCREGGFGCAVRPRVDEFIRPTAACRRGCGMLQPLGPAPSPAGAHEGVASCRRHTTASLCPWRRCKSSRRHRARVRSLPGYGRKSSGPLAKHAPGRHSPVGFTRHSPKCFSSPSWGRSPQGGGLAAPLSRSQHATPHSQRQGH